MFLCLSYVLVIFYKGKKEVNQMYVPVTYIKWLNVLVRLCDTNDPLNPYLCASYNICKTFAISVS